MIYAIKSNLPGAGKTYTTAQLVFELQSLRIPTYITGATWKAVEALQTELDSLNIEKTVVTLREFLRDYTRYAENGNITFHSKKLDVHTNTRGVIIIDEGFTLCKGYVEDIQRAYPFCNIVLTGDENQFTPIAQHVVHDREIIQDYNAAPEDEFAASYALDTCWRLKNNQKLISILKKVKNAQLTVEDLEPITTKKLRDGLHTCYFNHTWKEARGESKYYRIDFTDRKNGVLHNEIYKKCHAGFVTVYKNVENGKTFTTKQFESMNEVAVQSSWCNANKLQGATIHEKVDCVILKKELQDMVKYFDQTAVDTLQRRLYVELSRSEDSKIYFEDEETFRMMRRILKLMKPMEDVKNTMCFNDFVEKVADIPNKVIQKDTHESRYNKKIDKMCGLLLAELPEEAIIIDGALSDEAVGVLHAYGKRIQDSDEINITKALLARKLHIYTANSEPIRNAVNGTFCCTVREALPNKKEKIQDDSIVQCGEELTGAASTTAFELYRRALLTHDGKLASKIVSQLSLDEMLLLAKEFNTSGKQAN